MPTSPATVWSRSDVPKSPLTPATPWRSNTSFTGNRKTACGSGTPTSGISISERRYTRAMRIAAALLLAASAVYAAAPDYSGELIFPLEKWHNHSSSVVELPNGDLLVCWFHGSGEREADDVLINAARWNHSTSKWSEPFLLADTPGFPETNPVLFLDSKQRLMFFWPLIVAHKWETALMKYRIS